MHGSKRENMAELETLNSANINWKCEKHYEGSFAIYNCLVCCNNCIGIMQIGDKNCHVCQIL